MRAVPPKPGATSAHPESWQTGSLRPLGIPTVKDRVIQAAMKNILEPIFEAGFYPGLVRLSARPIRARGIGAS